MKTCSKCKVEKPLDEFYNHKNNPDGKTYDCKSCKKESKRKWREKNLNKIKEYDRIYKDKNRIKINSNRRISEKLIALK